MDFQILSLIKINESKFNKVSDLLHYFRYELKVACEEKRFKLVYLFLSHENNYRIKKIIKDYISKKLKDQLLKMIIRKLILQMN